MPIISDISDTRASGMVGSLAVVDWLMITPPVIIELQRADVHPR